VSWYIAAIEKLKVQGIYKLTRQTFVSSLLQANPELVSLWQSQLWERLPNELRLIYYRESEQDAHMVAENLIYRVKLNDALLLYQSNIRLRHFKLWKSLTSDGLRLRLFQRRKVCK
jgi:hypothetical protein